MNEFLPLVILETRGPRSDVPMDDDQRLRGALEQEKQAGRLVRQSIFGPPKGWSDEEWRESLEKSLSEADAYLRELRDQRDRPWRYRIKRGKRGPAPLLAVGAIIEMATHMNERGETVSLETLAEALNVSDTKTVAKALRHESLSITDIRDIGRSR